MNIHGLKKQRKETTQRLKEYLKLPKKKQNRRTIKNMHSRINRLNQEIKRRKQNVKEKKTDNS